MDHEALISTGTGSYLRKDHVKAVARAKRVLGQLSWASLHGAVAEKAAQLNAYLMMVEGQPIEHQDRPSRPPA
ncbi:TPA: hypothetical protein EYP44_02375 [Candidatus Bathyarchaeota archaeon]|nr:hypothetical protein [Candidatus Bathyarchaeota archaeon]